MDNSPKYEIPWDLIADSLTGNLSAEGEQQLKRWLELDPEHNSTLVRIQEIWKNGTENYRYYRMANEEKAWKDLQDRISTDQSENEKHKVIHADFGHRRKLIRNLLAIASVSIGLIAVVWYFTVRNNPDVFMAGSDSEKVVSLADGTVITLRPRTKIEVPRGFNISGRTVVMAAGEADFEVVHRRDLPFVVKLGSTEVRDIGTSFIIRRDSKMVHVAVSAGKVAFIRTTTKETRELEAGSSVSFDEQKEEFGSVKATETSEAFENMLTFESTPLSEVIQSIQKVYARNIVIADETANRKLTAKLYGMPFDKAMEVICTSLHLEYTVDGNTYMLKQKTSEEN